MKVRIEIDTKTFVRFWLVVIGFAFAILALYSARMPLFIIGTALFLALALNGPVSWMARRLPDRSRTLSTAIAFMAVIGMLAVVVFLVVPPIVQQTAKFIDSAPTLVREMSNQWRGLGNLIEKYHIQPQIDQAVAAIQADAGRFARDLGGNFISGIGSAFGWMMAATLTLVLTFLMLI
ncbi:MAG: AI-2E family transporter, partial [Candidatus Saccharimonas aalborgensis]